MADRGRRDGWVLAALERFEGPLTLYARELAGDLDRARDAVQDTFLRLCQQDRARIDDHLAEWLFTVCRNRIFDLKRKEGRMTTVSQHRERESQAPGPPDVAEAEDRMSVVMAAVANLPERQREVVRLKFQSGLSYREISGVTQLTVSHVGVIIHTAMKTLRAELGRGDLATR